MATMSRTPNNATITVSPAKHARAPRSKRVPVPTAKVRENQTLRRTRRATRVESPPPFEFRDVEDSDDDYEEENENTATGLEELLLLVRDLKKTIDQQSRSIQEAQVELKELKEEQQLVKEQNNELKDEICTLRDHVDNLSALLPSTPSWASIAAKRTGSGSMQQTSNGITAGTNGLVRHLPNQLTTTDTLYCTIDTSRVTDEDIRFVLNRTNTSRYSQLDRHTPNTKP
jgi:hypothetical protein